MNKSSYIFIYMTPNSRYHRMRAVGNDFAEYTQLCDRLVDAGILQENCQISALFQRLRAIGKHSSLNTRIRRLMICTATRNSRNCRIRAVTMQVSIEIGESVQKIWKS